MSKRTFKRLEFHIEDGGAYIRVPVETTAEAQSDTMAIVVYGQKESGQWIQVEARINRSMVEDFAHRLHSIIRLEENKVAAKKRAMLGQ